MADQMSPQASQSLCPGPISQAVSSSIGNQDDPTGSLYHRSEGWLLLQRTLQETALTQNLLSEASSFVTQHATNKPVYVDTQTITPRPSPEGNIHSSHGGPDGFDGGPSYIIDSAHGAQDVYSASGFVVDDTYPWLEYSDCLFQTLNGHGYSNTGLWESSSGFQEMTHMPPDNHTRNVVATNGGMFGMPTVLTVSSALKTSDLIAATPNTIGYPSQDAAIDKQLPKTKIEDVVPDINTGLSKSAALPPEEYMHRQAPRTARRKSEHPRKRRVLNPEERIEVARKRGLEGEMSLSLVTPLEG
ncbi:uncharacterized protein KY384_006206 [Bacidia gigantensis]|uniref:uncharacterized protein n=1 Tax=Bacidia gigantensis TaxID=2732470 RepID=UPI001D045454|nr:uncharacterized protein KY384_006206 [Bacidia gigantensis]KAG8529569.1 hypothetical protein KY384_006206 [Bacidia gigantensis]